MLPRDRFATGRNDAGADPCAAARELLGIQVSDPAVARLLLETAALVGDRRERWRALGLRLLADAPSAPGVYVMRDADGRALYVGKATNLRRRLGAYFRPGGFPRIAPMLAHADSITWELVGSELEALLREAERIAELAPLVNVQRRNPRHGTTRRAPVPDQVIVLPGAPVHVKPEARSLKPGAESVPIQLVCLAHGTGVLRFSMPDREADPRPLVQRMTRHFAGLLRAYRHDDERSGAARSGRPKRNASVSGLHASQDVSEAEREAIVDDWLRRRGEAATRILVRDASELRALPARLRAVLADPDLFRGRIDQREWSV